MPSILVRFIHSSMIAGLLALLNLSQPVQAESSGGYSFNAPLSNLGTPGSPWYSGVTGDFNNDGKLDLVVINSANNVAIQLGNGNGSLQPPAVVYSASGSPCCLAAGDFNGDGKLDLAIGGASSVSILLGRGDGTFGAPVAYALTHAPSFIVTSDFNRDGKLDLAVLTATGAQILLGAGDGTFQAGGSFAALSYPVGAAAQDFNGDGKPDLAIVSIGQFGQGFGLSILLGNGDGTFQKAVDYPAGNSPTSVSSADFNGDGNLDLVVSSLGLDDNGTLAILLGNGDGTFQPAHYVQGGASPFAAVGDFNGDGKVDLAVAHGSSTSILLNAGNGTFKQANEIEPGGIIALGDFNGDGKLDIAAPNGAILLGEGKGDFQHIEHESAGTRPVYLATADLNRDGNLDLVAADNQGLFILLGNGDETFRKGIFQAGVPQPTSIAIGDFNGDGIPDLAVTSASYNAPELAILLGNGDGTFQPPLVYALTGTPTSVIASDFNADGKLDLAVASSAAQGAGAVSILLGNGDGTFQRTSQYALTGAAIQLSSGDFNGDGKQDLAIISDRVPTLAILLGGGDGTFTPGVTYAIGAVPSAILVSDLNGDGNLDLALTDSSLNLVEVVIGYGDGTFVSPVDYEVELSPVSIAAAHLSEGGAKDLVVANSLSSTVSVLPGNGNGTFRAPTNFAVGSVPASLVAGDFNNDGKIDILTANSGSNDVTVLTNTSP